MLALLLSAVLLSTIYGLEDIPQSVGRLCVPEPRKVDQQFLSKLPEDLQKLPVQVIQNAPIGYLDKKLTRYQKSSSGLDGYPCAGLSPLSSSLTHASPGQKVPLAFQIDHVVRSTCQASLICPGLGYNKQLFSGECGQTTGKIDASVEIPADAPKCKPAECFIQWTMTTCESETFVDCADVCIGNGPTSPVAITSAPSCTSIAATTEILMTTEMQSVTIPPIVETTTFEQLTTEMIPPPIVTESETVTPAPLPPVPTTIVNTVTVISSFVDTMTVPPATSFVTITNLVTVTQTPAPISTTEIITLAPLPPPIVTSFVEETISALETTTLTTVLPPVIVTGTVENQVTLTLSPILVTETIQQTLPPLPPSTIIQTAVTVVPLTSTLEITQMTTEIMAVTMFVTETALSTQTITEMTTITPSPELTTDFTTITQSEQVTVVTLTQTSTLTQVMTQLETFTITSLIPSTVIVTPLGLRALRPKEMTTSCICPTLVCPTSTCIPSTVCVTVTAPCPVQLPYRRPYGA
jgi:hypothetical protein